MSFRRRKRDEGEVKEMRLMAVCFRAVRKHFSALGSAAILDLPVPLIMDLLPYLTVCQLDELQPALNQRGISTRCGWVGVLQDYYGPNHKIDLQSEEETKHQVMQELFPLIFYGIENQYTLRNTTNLKNPSFLWAAAKCIQDFLLAASLHKAFLSLTAEHRPLLSLLERNIRSVHIPHIPQSFDLLDQKTAPVLYVLHRLLDHGVATKLFIHAQCPIMLAWLLHGRGSQYVNQELKSLMLNRKAICISQVPPASADGANSSPGVHASASDDEDVIPFKRSKLDCVSVEEEKSGKAVDPQVLCQAFSSCEDPSSGACPCGQIDYLELSSCDSDSLRVLNSALPTFFSLCSLTLHSVFIFRDSDVLDLARALKQLSESSRSSISDLRISTLPNTNLIEVLLESCPALTLLHVDIQAELWETRLLPHCPSTANSAMPAELSLHKLTVKIAELQTDPRFMTSVLKRCPSLTCLHIAGMRLPTGSSQSRLLRTLAESNHGLRTLRLEDMKLSDCFSDILNLLRHCKLEELHLNDCRLLEECSEKEKSLQQLVAALKTLPSLHTLSLAQNRLAKNVCVLTELFSGSSPSSVECLNISSNFIQPADLLEFAERLRTHHPSHRLTLNLGKNLGDRDPNTWSAALKRLHPLCFLELEPWNSTNTMADYVSNM